MSSSYVTSMGTTLPGPCSPEQAKERFERDKQRDKWSKLSQQYDKERKTKQKLMNKIEVITTLHKHIYALPNTYTTMNAYRKQPNNMNNSKTPNLYSNNNTNWNLDTINKH